MFWEKLEISLVIGIITNKKRSVGYWLSTWFGTKYKLVRFKPDRPEIKQIRETVISDGSYPSSKWFDSTICYQYMGRYPNWLKDAGCKPVATC